MSRRPRKSILKRFKVTKTGKVLRRAIGQDHFRAKKTGKQKRQIRKWVKVCKSDAKRIKQLISS